MVFGRRPLVSVLRAGRWGFAAAALALLVAGCGGGGGNDNNNGGGGSNNATVVGRLVDANAAQPDSPVVGATVIYNGKSTTTNGNGQFAFSVAAPSGASTLRVGATNAYYNDAYYQNTSVKIQSVGIATPAIPASSAGQTVDLGTIRLFGVDGPPPPPF